MRRRCNVAVILPWLPSPHRGIQNSLELHHTKFSKFHKPNQPSQLHVRPFSPHSQSRLLGCLVHPPSNFLLQFHLRKLIKRFYLIIGFDHDQAKMSSTYPAPYSSSALMCLMASFQCVIIGLVSDHHISSWSLNPPIRALSSIYAVYIYITPSVPSVCFLHYLTRILRRT